MEEKHLWAMKGIDAPDWAKTPASVKELVALLGVKIEQLEARVKELELQNQELTEKAKRNSNNSNSPPASDSPEVEKTKKNNRSRRKRGGQKGHKGNSRKLYSVEECTQVKEYYPNKCNCCGEELSGEDSSPYRHQIVEIPEIKLKIEEHRLHKLSCEHCGSKTRAELPQEVEKSGYGKRVAAIVSLLSGMYHHSHQMVVCAMKDLFGVEMSVGSVNSLRHEASEAVSKAVEEAKGYIQKAAIVGADETRFKQGNADGKNEQKKKAWLWVAVTPLVSVFEVKLSRSTEAAESLLGKDFIGILNSDRYSAYNWIDVNRRQVCWAHLKREFTKISERSGVSRQIGRDLLAQQKKLFRLWHRVRDGTLSRSKFQSLVLPIQERLRDILSSTAQYQIGYREKTPLAKTVRTCRQLQKVEPALWLFITVEGLEPTNNAAERAIRPAVLWRRTSFGSQSEAGSLFVSRMLTVVTTLRSQNRNILAFLTDAIQASRTGSDTPCLLPSSTLSTQSMPFAA